MRIKFFLFFILLLGLNTVFSQDSTKFIAIHSVVPTNDDSDLKKLDSYFENVRLVGLGEATHGTHEFSTMRHRIFKYLVENHDFNTFFLEADYATCLRVNSYIHGADDEVEKAVYEIGLWPWITSEMVDVVNWMRQYNIAHPEKALDFIGVDAQSFTSTLNQIDRILNKYDLPGTDTSVYKPITDYQFNLLTEKKAIAPYFDLLAIKEETNTELLNELDRDEYTNLVRHLRQMIEIQNETKDYDQGVKRDMSMGANAIYTLNLDPALKGIFWGHNGHIVKVSIRQFGSKRWVGTTGGYLMEVLGTEYLSIGLEFDKGSFNAHHLDKESDIVIAENRYTLGEITVGPSAEGTYGSYYRKMNGTVFIDSANLPLDKRLYINNIGAVYYPDLVKDDKSSRARYTLYKQNQFDAIIIIPKTTATNLLRAKAD